MICNLHCLVVTSLSMLKVTLYFFLLVLLSGDVETSSGSPNDEVKCVYSSSEESGLMLQCNLIMFLPAPLPACDYYSWCC